MNGIDVTQESYHRCFGFNVEIWENLNRDHFDIRLFCLHHNCYLLDSFVMEKMKGRWHPFSSQKAERLDCLLNQMTSFVSFLHTASSSSAKYRTNILVLYDAQITRMNFYIEAHMSRNSGAAT